MSPTIATMLATITLATIDYAGDYSDYALAAGGGIAPLPPLPPLPGPAGRGWFPGSGPRVRSWRHDMQIKRIRAPYGVLQSIGINILADI